MVVSINVVYKNEESAKRAARIIAHDVFDDFCLLGEVGKEYGIYMYNTEAYQFGTCEFIFHGELDYTLWNDDFIALLKWFQLIGDCGEDGIDHLTFDYEDLGDKTKGRYSYFAETGKITNRFVPEEEWPTKEEIEIDPPGCINMITDMLDGETAKEYVIEG